MAELNSVLHFKKPEAQIFAVGASVGTEAHFDQS